MEEISVKKSISHLLICMPAKAGRWELVWENLESVFVFIRFEIKNNKNCQVADLGRIMEVIINGIKNHIENEQLCDMLVQIMPEWKGRFRTKTEVKQEVICNEELEQFIVHAVELMKDNLEIQHYDLAYDLADMLHALPNIVLANEKNGLKRYWKIYVIPVQKKWNRKLLKEFKYLFKRAGRV